MYKYLIKNELLKTVLITVKIIKWFVLSMLSMVGVFMVIAVIRAIVLAIGGM